MPRFRYKCLNCGYSFEEYAKNSHERMACPKCKSSSTRVKFTNSINSSPPANCG